MENGKWKMENGKWKNQPKSVGNHDPNSTNKKPVLIKIIYIFHQHTGVL
jgi:hypothetical protein